MNDPRRSGQFGSPLTGSGPAGPQGSQNPTFTDPAYADQAPYAPTYGGQPQWGPSPSGVNPTQQLPRDWQQEPPPGEMPQQGMEPPPPEGPKLPRWLWVAAVVAVLLVVASVIALILANGAIKTQTAVPPLPAMPGSSSKTPTPTTTRSPSASAAPAPTSGTDTPTETNPPTGAQPVVYSVTGEGRAISVTYMDTGDVIQTEFNVSLPWSKQVSLSQSAIRPSVTIVNIGHDVTCSLTVSGVQVRQRTGVGLTICDAPAS
jgi:hypothetical protein